MFAFLFFSEDTNQDFKKESFYNSLQPEWRTIEKSLMLKLKPNTQQTKSKYTLTVATACPT